MHILTTSKDGKSEVVDDGKSKKPFRFLPLDEDKVFFIYISGLLMKYNVLASLFLFFVFGTALLNNVGHLMKDKEKEEKWRKIKIKNEIKQINTVLAIIAVVVEKTWVVMSNQQRY